MLRPERRGTLGMRLGLTLALAWQAGCAHYQAMTLEPEDTRARFAERRLDDPGLAARLHASAPETPWPPDTWDLESLSWAALFFHPSLDVARAAWQASSAGIESAGGRPNPTVGLAPAVSANPGAGALPWILGVSVDLPVELGGKRDFRIAKAQGLSEASRLRVTSVAWQVRARLRRTLAARAVAERRAALLDRQADLQRQITSRLEQEQAAGAVSYREVSTARLGLGRLEMEAAEAHRQIGQSQIDLAEAIGVPSGALEGARFATLETIEAPLEGPVEAAGAATAETTHSRGGDAPSTPASSPAAAASGPDPELERALTTRPDLLASLAEFAASQADLQLEIARQLPDLHLGTGYQFDQGQHKWSLGIMIEVPIFNQNEGPIAEAVARRREAAARFLELQTRILAEIERARAAALSVGERLATLASLRQHQERASQRVTAQLAAGAADRLDVLSAEAELLATDVLRTELEGKRAEAEAALEEALESPFPALAAVFGDAAAGLHSEATARAATARRDSHGATR